MNIGFVTNKDKDLNLNFTKRLINFILENNSTPILTSQMAKQINLNCKIVLDIKELFEKSEFIIVLGGDGTMLRAAKNASLFDTKLLGINIGTLGYLTDVEQEDAFEAIKKVLNNNYNIEKRMMLDVFIENSKLETERKTVLNEVSIVSSGISRMLKISVSINGEFVDIYRADGIIVSTPTGSTAYSLSAGGPILKPDTDLIIINYICPHALFARPYVISGDDEVTISIIGENDNASISLDGQENISIKNSEIIRITKSSFYTNIIKTNNLNFFTILRKKMVDARK